MNTDVPSSSEKNQMRLFCITCRNLANIPLGVAANLWAVATTSESAAKARRTKAMRYFKPGDIGLLYCNPLHAFTVPFIVRSHPDPDKVVTDVWPEAWVLPFKIEPLGDGSRQVSKELARAKWGLLQRLPWKGSISATLNFTGTTTFVPTMVERHEWEEILSDLCN